MTAAPIGLIGVGLLGTALAERMLAGGLPVTGYDLQPLALERLQQLGGQRGASAAAVAAACETIVLCLPDSQIVAEVIADIGKSLRPHALVIDATTGDPDHSAAIAELLSQRGIGYVDATIAGSSEQVRRGEATVLLGGELADMERASPVLATWSPRRFHIGACGSGARLKLIVNLVLGLNRAVLAEGLSLASACGIDPAKALEVLKETPAYSAAMESKGPKMVAHDYQPQARLAQHAKDVVLIRALAARHDQAVPLSDVHAQLLARAIELGLADADNSAIIEAWGRRNAECRMRNAE
jgi:3-hydroxyisobutyrate dehydrogenase-like beta-hydroxyacid dehydrogenase